MEACKPKRQQSVFLFPEMLECDKFFAMKTAKERFRAIAYAAIG